MINYQPLYNALTAANAEAWAESLPAKISSALTPQNHGSLANWLSIVAELPAYSTDHRDLSADTVHIGSSEDISEAEQQILKTHLSTFHPWRKGPYNLYGIHIDTEWRSDWKWHRLKNHIAPLKDRMILDVGCGNGYHCWRMLGEQAKMVIGIDPLALNVMQFQLIRKLYGDAPIYVLPQGIEDLPANLKCFDTVFSMGVLYHRRSPIDHLLELRDCLRTGGELILETLIIDGGLGESLLPKDRYAKMRNVWFIPTCDTLLSWLERCGFSNCRVVDVNITSTEEQRSTDWMTFNSLKDFLDPENPSLTIEGFPAPKRAIVVANAP